jgi:sugar phosphate isomerase/epimerase
MEDKEYALRLYFWLRGISMIVAFHSAPKGFFKTNLPHSNAELVGFVRKTASLGFRAVQIGPLCDYVSVESDYLRRVLDSLNMERNVHVGGLYDAELFALTETEYSKVQKEIHSGIELCKQLSSKLVSVHPPFFATVGKQPRKLLFKAQTRFFELLKGEVDFASSNGVMMALESFCYSPFIFEGLDDFAQFISKFSSEDVGVLLDAGHVYQVGFNLAEAINKFKHRLLDVHIHDATLEKEYQKATHLPIGKGTINFSWLVSFLQEAKYDAWLTLEIRGSEEEIVRSKEYLESLIRKTR